MKSFGNTPNKQGMYDPSYEHDACGIGLIANIKGKKSHKIVSDAIKILINLDHRGAKGSDPNTGDGAGILVQVPHDFFLIECKKNNIELPSLGNYGVGMFFMPNNPEDSDTIHSLFEEVLTSFNLKILGYRDVPIDSSKIGIAALEAMPNIVQVFIEKPSDIETGIAFERKLFIARKVFENKLSKKYPDIPSYLCSFSSRTIVYKGMLTSPQLNSFYLDLNNESFKSALALIHSRYSTNTFPSWERAHPNRTMIHNGEINTIRGNVNWLNSREKSLSSKVFGEDLNKLFPIVNAEGSDSSMFDNCLEFLYMSGYSMSHAAIMMIPEPWSKHTSMDEKLKDFYYYNSCLMEPWDGPAAIGFTDGIEIGAILDRNGLRPTRYSITKDNTLILASETGVLDIPESDILVKDKIHPGRILLINTEKGEIIENSQLKKELSEQYPYSSWVKKGIVQLNDAISKLSFHETIPYNFTALQKVFGYTQEDLINIIKPMAVTGHEPIGSMGNDIPLAVLSKKPQLLFNYFKQLFAQVTNPPIDSIREEIITGTELYLGSQGNLLQPSEEGCKMIEIKNPILNNDDLAKLKNVSSPNFKSIVLPILFDPSDTDTGLKNHLEYLFKQADSAILEGYNIIILSDRGVDKRHAAIPSLLAVSALHHHLIRKGTRTKLSIVIETGEAREVHHFATLIGYGASAINPYLVFYSIKNMVDSKHIDNMKYAQCEKNYLDSVLLGIIKILSKMGISTLQSYHGAQIFEALGIDSNTIDKYFTGTPSRIEGISLKEIAMEVAIRHKDAFHHTNAYDDTLPSGGYFKWRAEGEYHLYNPEAIYYLQQSCRDGNYDMFKKYTGLFSSKERDLSTLRSLMKFKTSNAIKVDISEVESVDSICKRFKTGAMSYGSISKEAHESLAIAMNSLGGKSNSGEGGEDSERFKILPSGENKRSAIKQVASGRFGVTSYYLVNADEIQIKMAQGAKPGEGGQLPSKKVYPWIAKARHSTPGVGLISPPPHHDIYSIEDLAELIHDLKNANPEARINVKLVSEVGVGTIAAGVAKGKADVILVSGYDGGTGAASKTSIRHAGLPWELGLSEVQQTLLLNNLRDRVVVETDGKLMTGRDVVIAALLGAEEFGFATAPLITLGCCMMRICNLDTCPVGVATQNPELRKNFVGKPEYVVNFMRFIAQEIREYMASLGIRSFNELIGRSDFLEMDRSLQHWKSRNLNFSKIFHVPDQTEKQNLHSTQKQKHGLEDSLDETLLVKKCMDAITQKKKISMTLPISNTNRVVGTILGYNITKLYGEKGLKEDSINLLFNGSAGQSFGAFLPSGISLTLEGDGNDYVGKGLSGGKIIVKLPDASRLKSNENIIIGNVAFYGATKGEAYIAGLAGERFCVRNSGVNAVVEGIGDHGCEYMTGGKVVVLGKTGRNFAAGMSGGIAYVLDLDNTFKSKCNTDMVALESLIDSTEISEVRGLIEKHAQYTNSKHAKNILDNWLLYVHKIVKVIPHDYKRMIESIEKVLSKGKSYDEARMLAFYENTSFEVNTDKI